MLVQGVAAALEIVSQQTLPCMTTFNDVVPTHLRNVGLHAGVKKSVATTLSALKVVGSALIVPTRMDKTQKRSSWDCWLLSAQKKRSELTAQLGLEKSQVSKLERKHGGAQRRYAKAFKKCDDTLIKVECKRREAKHEEEIVRLCDELGVEKDEAVRAARSAPLRVEIDAVAGGIGERDADDSAPLWAEIDFVAAAIDGSRGLYGIEPHLQRIVFV
ncbi:unnamed protein product [Linum tenue]|uniref:Uncharacterized protein n=1 Tax=Linum tenue TaxID=586396 RepID=A0AAV0QZ41_9ROSI|nr:unnamed protein product [Linum tenue]